MANVDGDITLSVQIVANDVASAATDIKKDLEGIFDSTVGQKLSKEFDQAKVSASKFYDRISDIQTRMLDLENTTFETRAYSEIQSKITDVSARLNEATDRLRTFADANGKIDTNNPMVADLITKIKQLSAEFSNLETQRKGLIKNNGAFIPGTDTVEYDKLVRQLNDVTNSASVARNRLLDLSEIRPNYSQYDILQSRIESVKSSIVSLATGFKNTVTGAFGVKNALAGIANVTIDLHKKFLTLLKTLGSNVLKSAGSALKNLGSAMSGFNSHTRQSNNLLTIGFKKFVQYGLGIRTVFLLIKKLRQAMIDGFGYITQYSGEFNSVVSEFVSALNTLKLAFATAFAPIASVALPLLTALMNALIDAMNTIGKFFAAITGKSTFIQAKRNQTDYAASLDKTGKSGGTAAKGIKKAEKAAKDAQKTIAGFDDVEILKDKSKDTADTGGSGGGGGGGASGTNAINGANLFETVGIESKIKDFANKLRDLIGAQDWTGLGAFLGQCINSVFAKAKDLISWDNVGDKITFFVTAITDTFNSLVGAINWELIGSTFAEGINTVVNTLLLLINGIDWKSLGSGIGRGIDSLFRDINWTNIGLLISSRINMLIDLLYGFLSEINFERIATDLTNMLNTAIDTIEWETLGETLALAFNGLLDFLYGVITTFKWGAVAKKLTTALSTFLRNVNWKKLGATISELLIGVLEFLHEAIRTFDWVGLVQAIFSFLLGVDWTGLLGTAIGAQFGTFAAVGITLIKALGTAIATAAKGIQQYFKTEIENAGGDIVAGMLNGILNAVLGFGRWLRDNVLIPFLTAFDKAFKINSPSKVMEERGGFIISGLYNGISNAWKKIKTFFTNSVKTVREFFKVDEWKTAGSTAVNKLYSGISGVWSTVTSFFSRSVAGVKRQITTYDWKSAGKAVTNGIRGGINAIWYSEITQNVRGKIVDVKNQFIDYAEDWKKAGQAVTSGIKGGLNSIWNSDIVQNVRGKIVDIKNQFIDYAEDWKKAGQSIVTGVKSGVSDKYSELTTKVGELVADVKDKFDIDWTSIGEDICSGIKDGIKNGWDWVTTKAKELAEAAKQAAEDKLEINSPSKVFRDRIGEAIPEGMAVGIEENAGLATNAVSKLAKEVSAMKMPEIELPDVVLPDIAMGKILPYEIQYNMDNVNESIKTLIDTLKYNQLQNPVTKDNLVEVLNAILPTMLQRYVSFYIGDEQIARHANAGNSKLDYRFNPSGGIL